MPKKKRGPKGPSIRFTDEQWSTIEKLALIRCTGKEIADVMGCDYKTLERRVEERQSLNFGEWLSTFASKSRASLRRRQYQAALDGNTRMMIWLGQQWLDQSAKGENKVSSPDGSMIPRVTIMLPDNGRGD